jgi:hypothetical protein
MFGRSSTSGSPPPREEVIENVPAQAVEGVRRDFEDSGAVEVRIESKADGTFTVKAIFPS